METKYWTREYISGIRLFIHDVEEQTKLIENEIQKVKRFNDQCWKPFLKNVKSVEGMSQFSNLLTNSSSNSQFDSMTNKASSLAQLLKENQQYGNDYEKEITPIYDRYYDNMIRLRQLDRHHQQKQNDMQVNVKEPNTAACLNDYNITYPYQLDSQISIKNEQEMVEYIEMLKTTIPLQKNLFGKEYFKGVGLITILKKRYPLIDTSQYNMNRLGQMLLDMAIIEEYSARTLYLTRTQIMYDMNRSYNWVKPELAVVTSSSSSSSSQDTNCNNFEPFMQQYIIVEEDKVNLETVHCRNCRHYNNVMIPQIYKKLIDTETSFQRLVSSIFRNVPFTLYDPHPLNHGYSYYSRDNGIVMNYDQNKQFMFGCDKINEDILQAVRLLLEQCNGRQPNKIDIWHGDIDLQRVSKLKLVVLQKFMKCNGSNVESIKQLIQESEVTSTYITRDWADLVKLWLYELPGGLLIRDNINRKLIVPQVHGPAFTLFVSHWRVASGHQEAEAEAEAVAEEDRALVKLLDPVNDSNDGGGTQLIQSMIRDSPGSGETIEASAKALHRLILSWDSIDHREIVPVLSTEPPADEPEFVPLPFRTAKQSLTADKNGE
ncbi:similar to Saccharomyces cerevisiae YHR182W Putative protein of unknown function [Maudiozyma barnettii]|uniref:Uncharacterized protein n=1 Tax=Maudiozyma barnettii TaxID=61262 RepID=A0A8H2ZJ57_9SACH|nr:Rgd3p [Kazachstania barnettii]CAB4256202.1 similar to Saccharomyces cerevisiae YHR182W Putative protein of unknown function [Kazachstania barnettii]CAD1784810.1 similar to Saccharomyces cerevisiae YHR182W Putative protein of unknown function [Kazachstania barnettii]